MRVGVLALQGDFREHGAMLRTLGVEPIEVRQAAELEAVDRLIIPGGESTTIGRLLARFGLLAPLRERVRREMPLWGTCAGAIVMARTILDGRPAGQERLEVMDVAVRRNAFGRQRDSFEVLVEVPEVGGAPLPGVFIRAPEIVAVGPGVEVLARLDNGAIVAAREGRMLATSFHPELTDDTRLHRYFLDL